MSPSAFTKVARERMDATLPRMMEAAGVTEELKARDPRRWVGLMNTLKAQAEDIILTELIYQWLLQAEAATCGLCLFYTSDTSSTLYSSS